jgi:hypothetical protein
VQKRLGLDDQAHRVLREDGVADRLLAEGGLLDALTAEDGLLLKLADVADTPTGWRPGWRRWWRPSMSSTGVELLRLRKWLKRPPGSHP